MNQTKPTNPNPCYIGKDVLPRLRQREAHLANLRQARCLYWQQNLALMIVCFFVSITTIGVLGGVHFTSLGLGDLSATFIGVSIGSSILAGGAWICLRSIVASRNHLAAKGYRYGY